MALAAQETLQEIETFQKGSSVYTELTREGGNENKGLSNWARG